MVVASGSWDDAQARVAFALTDSQHLHGTHLLSPSRVVPRRMARASASLAAAAAHALTPPPALYEFVQLQPSWAMWCHRAQLNSSSQRRISVGSLW